jgi:hypothetical protein
MVRLAELLDSELDAIARDPTREPELRLSAWEELERRELERGDLTGSA